MNQPATRSGQGTDGYDKNKKPNKGSQLLRREAEKEGEEGERELTSLSWLPFFMGARWRREMDVDRQQPIICREEGVISQGRMKGGRFA